jgi:hypothetical protein
MDGSRPLGSMLLRVSFVFGIAALTAACTENVIVRKASTTSQNETKGASGAVPPPAPMPAVPYAGGGIIEKMNIVTVTVDGDSLRSVAESFDDSITSTPWWDAVTAGYCDAKNNCIGHGTGAGHVHLPAGAIPAGKYSDDGTTASGTIGGIINDNIQNGTFPPPKTDTVYAIYLPPSATLTDITGSVSCVGYGGYHASLTMTPPGASAPLTFAYVIVPRCYEGAEELTLSASHELIETATDPFSSARRIGFGSTTDAWDLNGGGEVGDRCEFLYEPSDMSTRMTMQESGFAVQRIWNNVAAAAGHDPCVPAPAPADAPYFNVLGATSDVVTLAVGASKTLELTAFADARLGEPIQVSVEELTKTMGGHDVLDLTLDESSRQPGDKLHVTVKLKAAPDGPQSPTGDGQAAVFQVVSTVGGTTNYSLFAVTSH